MRLNIKNAIVVLSAVLLSAANVSAGDGTNNVSTPYSKFGIGSLHHQGTTFNQSMGGTGVASRNHHFINVMNPAAVAARDTLAFMADFGVYQGNSYYMQGVTDGPYLTSASNTFNIDNFVMSFPIWRSSAFAIGIAPYSNVGYGFSESVTDVQTIGYTGNASDSYAGNGSIYQLYFSAGATFWKRLSVGAQFLYYFGDLTKETVRTFSSSFYRSIYSGYDLSLRAFSGKFGMQYEQPIGKKNSVIIGATYRLAANMKGTDEYLSYASQSSVIDTMACRYPSVQSLSIPSEISVGISYKYSDKFTAEFDYSYSDWRKSNMDVVDGFANKGFTTSDRQSFNLGFEYVPNRSDIRYYMKRCSYRAGAYYNTEYYLYGGRPVRSMGITLGMTFPVFKWLNGLSFTIDFGQRGSLSDVSDTYSPIRERYVNFSFSFNIFDIWFIKPKYE